MLANGILWIARLGKPARPQSFKVEHQSRVGCYDKFSSCAQANMEGFPPQRVMAARPRSQRTKATLKRERNRHRFPSTAPRFPPNALRPEWAAEIIKARSMLQSLPQKGLSAIAKLRSSIVRLWCLTRSGRPTVGAGLKLASFAIRFDGARVAAQRATPLTAIGCAGASA